MKKFLFSLCLLAGLSATASVPPIEVSEKVLKAFKATFYEPEQIKWFENANGYEVYFKADGVDSKVWYDKEGNITKSRRYYDESKLPSYVVSKLKSKFAGKSVFGVTEVTDEDGVNYYIKMEDDKTWYTIKSDSGARFEVLEKYKKA